MAEEEFPPGSPPTVEEPLLEQHVDIESGGGGRNSMSRTRSGTPGALRLTVRHPSMQPPQSDGLSPAYYALALRNADGAAPTDVQVQEMEVEILTEAVADAVAEAVAECVGDAVNDAVQTAIDEGRFDFKANIYTLIAVTAAVLLERGVWNTWDQFFGDDTLTSNLGSLVIGLTVLLIIRILNLPLATTIPGR